MTRSIAVIGCGYWGRNLVRNMEALGALRAVVEPSAAGQAVAREISAEASVHSEPAAVLEDPAVRAVMIATPAETHYGIACAAIDAGKDVFVEKPLTVDLREARDLVERAERADRILMVGHLLEYHPAILKIRELIDAGELGDVRYIVSNRLNLGKIRTEENALWSFAPHDIAVVLRLVGQLPFEIVATGGSYISPGVADVTVTQLLFQNGVRAHVFVSWLHPFKEQKLVVIGSKRMVSFDDVEKKLLQWDLEVEWSEGQPIPVKHDGVAIDYGTAEPLRGECQHFLDSIESREPPRTDGHSGVYVLQLLHAAQESIDRRGEPIGVGIADSERKRLSGTISGV